MTYHPATDTRDAAYRKNAVTGKSAKQRAEYLRVVQRATRGMPKDSGGMIWNVTDQEAAKIMGVGINIITARRSELDGSKHSPRPIQDKPLVEKAVRRRCHVTGSTAWAWRAR